MTNREIRSWYLREVAKIAEVDKDRQTCGDSIEAHEGALLQNGH